MQVIKRVAVVVTGALATAAAIGSGPAFAAHGASHAAAPDFLGRWSSVAPQGAAGPAAGGFEQIEEAPPQAAGPREVSILDVAVLSSG